MSHNQSHLKPNNGIFTFLSFHASVSPIYSGDAVRSTFRRNHRQFFSTGVSCRGLRQVKDVSWRMFYSKSLGTVQSCSESLPPLSDLWRLFLLPILRLIRTLRFRLIIQDESHRRDSSTRKIEESTEFFVDFNFSSPLNITKPIP